MWEISSIGQGNAALYSFLLGVIIGVIYDIFRLDRMIFKRSTVTVVFEDILFWLISAFLVFCLLLITTNGQVRTFVIASVGVSFLVYNFTVSRFVLFLAKPLKKLSRKIAALYNKLIKNISKIDIVCINLLKNTINRFKSTVKWQKKEKNNVKNT